MQQGPTQAELTAALVGIASEGLSSRRPLAVHQIPGSRIAFGDTYVSPDPWQALEVSNPTQMPLTVQLFSAPSTSTAPDRVEVIQPRSWAMIPGPWAAWQVPAASAQTQPQLTAGGWAGEPQALLVARRDRLPEARGAMRGPGELRSYPFAVTIAAGGTLGGTSVPLGDAVQAVQYPGGASPPIAAVSVDVWLVAPQGVAIAQVSLDAAAGPGGTNGLGTLDQIAIPTQSQSPGGYYANVLMPVGAAEVVGVGLTLGAPAPETLTVEGLLVPLPYAPRYSPAAQGVATPGSGTIGVGGTSQLVFSANSARRYLLIENPTTATEALYVRRGAAATADYNSISLAPGGSYTMEGNFIGTEAVYVLAATAGHGYYAEEA